MEILLTILGIIGGMGGLYVALKNSMKKEITEPIEYKIDKLTKCECKNFLVQFLNDKENGVELNHEYNKRAHEVKDKAKKLDVNSYIASKWERLWAKGGSYER